jgi:hypothetical protein
MTIIAPSQLGEYILQTAWCKRGAVGEDVRPKIAQEFEVLVIA